MEAWRSRGYVPDSDEEEEFESQERRNGYIKDKQISPVEDDIENLHSQSVELCSDNELGTNSSDNPTKIDIPTIDIQREEEDVASSSEDEIQVAGGTSLKHLVVDHTSNLLAHQIDDIFPDYGSTSSLSPVPSTNSSGPTQQTPHIQDDYDNILENSIVNDGDNNSREFDTASQNVANTLSLQEIPGEILDEISQAVRRSFRPRQLIQLHPYQLEDARYRGQFKDAGIKPVRVLTTEPAPADPQKESQEYSDSLPMESIYPPSSPLLEPYMSSHSVGRRRTFKEKGNRSSEQDQPRSHKRRKLLNDDEEKQGEQQSASIPVVIDKANTPLDSNTTKSADVLPTPPYSGSAPSVTTLRKDGFRFPRGFIQPQTTPPTTAPPVSMDVDDDLPVQDDMEIDVSVEAVEEPSKGDEDNGEEDSQMADLEVKQLKRRIKGVLPASWLRLDLKHQGVTSGNSSLEKQKRISHGTQAESLKGVAKKVFRPRSAAIQSPTPQSALNLTRDSPYSSDSDDNVQVLKENHKHAASMDFTEYDSPFIGIDDDIPEDNRIADMFPLTSRLSFSPRKERSNRSKTYSMKQVSRAHHPSDRSRTQRQTRIDEHTVQPSRHRTSRPRAPKLSILDAPDVAQRPRVEQPQFLRIASRQARSRRDRGRSSPSGKFLQMPTREETREINQNLLDWRKGTMKQTKLPMMTKPLKGIRQPLRNMSVNTPILSGRRDPDSFPRVSTIKDRSRNNLGESNPTSSNIARIQSATVSPVKKLSSSASAKLSRTGNMKVIPRKYTISSLNRNFVRPVESEDIGVQNASSNFEARLAALSRMDRRQADTINRFFTSMKPSSSREPARFPRPATQKYENNHLTSVKQKPNKIPRKRVPTHAEIVDADPMPQVMSSFESRESVFVSPADHISSTSNYLHGLNHYTGFSVDFGILPIQRGTFFHSSTFIGEGCFSRSLSIDMRDMDQEVGFASINLRENQKFRWGAWNEAVSSELDMIMNKITKDTVIPGPGEENFSKSDTIQFLTSAINYITEKLYFIDPVDRMSFIERSEFLSRELKDHIAMMIATRENEWKHWLKLASLNAVWANQVQQIALHEAVNKSWHEITLNLVRDIFRQLLSLVFSQRGLESIHQFYESNQVIKFRESGIRDDYPAVEAYVIAFQVLYSSQHFRGWFRDITLSLCIDKVTTKVQDLEEIWRIIFTTVPLNEIDKFGVAHPGLRFRNKADNWLVVQTLLLKVLDAYGHNSDHPVYYINYCLVVFRRCLVLMVSWGWRECKVILETLFDFYAKNMMYNLKNEESFSSPSFLDSLDTNPIIGIEPGDSSFHLFLKIIGSGLRYLSQINEKRTMRNIAWRLLPNHGRVYPKDKTLDHEDLNALRNHHDLLCTLYWAVPDGCRPRLETIRNLIDPATSHLETCNLSIRSWRRLVHFKLSSNEDNSGLKPFADWYGSFTSELVRQHQLAKTEVEAQAKGQIQFSKQDVELTISHNQRKIEALISSTIAAMESAIQSSRSFNQASSLVEGVPFSKLFGLFDPTNPRINPLVSESLRLVISFLTKDSPLIATAAHTVNDDSQEYGDWSAIEEVYDDALEGTTSATTNPYLQETIQPDVYRLLSNCFGEDRSPEDFLLLKVTECWSCLAHSFVQNGLHHWDNFLNPYSNISWTALRMTPQTKKFAPQFLASCLEKDNGFFTECKSQILTMWASSLVERASALKFQHHLTEVLLNVYEAPLLKNLPFYRGKDNRHHITLPEFTERRISLISSLLSNIREHLQEPENLNNVELRNEYKEFIMALMASMKANYQELSQSGKAAQGQYVEFVHCIIGFMQQHSQSICRVDRFFTEPASFPLPLNDPGYIVAKLKSYGVRLPAGKAAKELVIFLQGVCELAALDDKQDELVDQLYTCMCDTYESGDANKPTLRSFLFQCLFPAYIECSLSNPAAWILVLPIYKTVCRAIHNMMYDIDINDQDCIASVMDMFGAILRSIQHVLRVFLNHQKYVKEPPAFVILRSCVEVVTSMFPVLDYINRNGTSDVHISTLQILHEYTTLVLAKVTELSLQDIPFVESSVGGRYLPSLLPESSTFALREFQRCLHSNWSRHDGRYFVLRGRESREIQSKIVKSKEIADIEEAKSGFVDAASKFLHHFEQFSEEKLQLNEDLSRSPTTYDLLGEGINDLIL